MTIYTIYAIYISMNYEPNQSRKILKPKQTVHEARLQSFTALNLATNLELEIKLIWYLNYDSTFLARNEFKAEDRNRNDIANSQERLNGEIDSHTGPR